MADSEKSIVEYISEVDELLETSEFMQSEMVDEALAFIVKLIHKPDVPQSVAVQYIVKLQGISSMCYIQANVLKSIKMPKAGTDDYKKKNMLFALATALDSLVAGLKYLCR